MAETAALHAPVMAFQTGPTPERHLQEQTGSPASQGLQELVAGEARDSLLAIHELLASELPPGPLVLYEAGGGSTSFLPASIIERSHVTVVDIDEQQVRNNSYADRAVLGDIQTYRFPRESFDLIVCYNVIEHLPDVGAALLNFFGALRRGGLILIGAPNPYSLSGLVTRYSPHWFHVWFYRNIRGEKHAGEPGHAPFPTFYHPLVTPKKLAAFARTHGFEVIYRSEVESPRFPEMRMRQPRLAALIDAAAWIMNSLLPGKIDVRRGDYHLVLRKR